MVAWITLMVSQPVYPVTFIPENPAYDMAAADTHWGFVPLIKPDVPVLADEDSTNAVDAFVLTKLHEFKLHLNRPADKRSLIRRVTYDLTGLPPAFEQVEAFVADASPDAYFRLVERLLDSPAYGERWARHWLDVARYADTKGVFGLGRYSFSHTYRDYVIRSFNEDKPYDQFILEQLAADQLDLGEDKAALAAMGFLTLGRTFFGRKDFIIDDQIDVVTRGLQGLTVTCARCHDHKFDPIPTTDYYSLHGIFASSRDPEELPVIRYPEDEAEYQCFLAEKQRIENEIQIKTDEVIDTFLAEERALAGGYLNAADAGKTMESEDDFKVFAGSRGLNSDMLHLWMDYLDTVAGRAHPVLKTWFDDYKKQNPEGGVAFYNEAFASAAKEDGEGYAAIRAFFQEPGTPLNPDREAVAQWIRRRIGGKVGDLKDELQTLDWTHPGAPVRAHVLEDIDSPKNSSVYKRGDPNNLGEEVPRQYLQVLTGLNRKPFSKGSGRLELALEIVDENNPLTARVFVNRVWGWHMGKGIVDTPSDFGVRTPEPVHLDLLNWLAAAFVESDWSIKALHRLIVLSKAYQQSSSPHPEALVSDPGNKLWHHFARTRLDFESMRDTLLMVSGNLDQTMGGIPVDITDPTANRRTVYSFIDRQDMPGIFRTFDHPSPEATSPSRFETAVPQQALFLMNSPFVIEQARHLANRVKKFAGEDGEERIRWFYRLAFQREATGEEIQTGLGFMANAGRVPDAGFNAGPKNPGTQKPLGEWELYAQVLLLSNELMFLD